MYDTLTAKMDGDIPEDLDAALKALKEDQLEIVTYMGEQAGGAVFCINLTRIIECCQLIHVETTIRYSTAFATRVSRLAFVCIQGQIWNQGIAHFPSLAAQGAVRTEADSRSLHVGPQGDANCSLQDDEGRIRHDAGTISPVDLKSLFHVSIGHSTNSRSCCIKDFLHVEGSTAGSDVAVEEGHVQSHIEYAQAPHARTEERQRSASAFL